LALAPVAVVGWVVFGLLALAVRVALFRDQRTQGITSVLWGLGFALFVWFGVRAFGLRELQAIPFALVSGAGIALFIYLRGAALENPPAEQPGAFYRRRRARRRASRAARAGSRPRSVTTRELVQARVALSDGELAKALSLLREAERVAVAQRRLDELLEVRGLVGSLAERSEGRRKDASERLARRVEEELRAFPADALAAAGIHVEPEPALPELVRELRARADPHGPASTSELVRARAALEVGELATALRLLQEARRVAIAQRRLGELLEIHQLVQVLAERSSGRARATTERLADKVEAGLREFAQAPQ
jgi:hypothetical protein